MFREIHVFIALFIINVMLPIGTYAALKKVKTHFRGQNLSEITIVLEKVTWKEAYSACLQRNLGSLFDHDIPVLDIPLLYSRHYLHKNPQLWDTNENRSLWISIVKPFNTWFEDQCIPYDGTQVSISGVVNNRAQCAFLDVANDFMYLNLNATTCNRKLNGFICKKQIDRKFITKYKNWKIVTELKTTIVMDTLRTTQAYRCADIRLRIIAVDYNKKKYRCRRFTDHAHSDPVPLTLEYNRNYISYVKQRTPVWILKPNDRMAYHDFEIPCRQEDDSDMSTATSDIVPEASSTENGFDKSSNKFNVDVTTSRTDIIDYSNTIINTTVTTISSEKANINITSSTNANHFSHVAVPTTSAATTAFGIRVESSMRNTMISDVTTWPHAPVYRTILTELSTDHLPTKSVTTAPSSFIITPYYVPATENSPQANNTQGIQNMTSLEDGLRCLPTATYHQTEPEFEPIQYKLCYYYNKTSDCCCERDNTIRRYMVNIEDLRVGRKNVSRYKRSLISVWDRQLSSTVIGSFAVILLVTVTMLLVAGDLLIK